MTRLAVGDTVFEATKGELAKQPGDRILGVIQKEGLANQWHILWSGKRETDENEDYGDHHRRRGEPRLIKVD